MTIFVEKTRTALENRLRKLLPELLQAIRLEYALHPAKLSKVADYLDNVTVKVSDLGYQLHWEVLIPHADKPINIHITPHYLTPSMLVARMQPAIEDMIAKLVRDAQV